MSKTTTSAFGAGKRAAHAASAFYRRNVCNGVGVDVSPAYCALIEKRIQTIQQKNA